MPANSCQSSRQSDMIEGDEIAEQMQFALTILRRNLDARHNLNGGAGCRSRRQHTAERIVIRDRQRGQPGPASEIDNLNRRVGSVAVRGVDVQIDAPGILATRSELTEC